MSTPEHVVIVGGGLAGAKSAEALVDRGFRGTVTLVGAEARAPYERPPLSKGYLAGESPIDEAIVHPEEWYRDHGVALRLGTRAVAIDRGAHEVRLDDGTALPYDGLVLATGSVPRRPGLPGADAPGVPVLRTVEDADAIRSAFGPGQRLVVVGGGWIGLEVAAAARSAETGVAVVHRSALPLQSALGPELAEVFVDLHREHGVDLRLGARVAEILVEDGRAAGVLLDGGEVIPADAVVLGIGAIPDVALAEAAGLAVDDGVLVDAALRTSDPAIVAVGDIANHDHPILGHRIRVEHWATALNQPAVAVAALLGGDEPYTELPYFFSDQYDLGMEHLGEIPREGRLVVRGDLARRELVALHLDAGRRVRAVTAVNVWDVIDEVKPLVLEGRVIDPDRAADPAVPWSEL